MSGESRPILRLAVPLVIGQLSQMLMGVVDTMMVADVGIVELAALTFANVIFHVPFVFGIGLLTCISVRTSNARGAGNPQAARATCRHGVYLALVVSTVLFLLSLILAENLAIFKQPEDVTERTPAFFRIVMASMIPALVSIALKNHSDALNRPWPAFWIFMGGVGLNVVLNWLLIFGNLGFPELGLEGAAWGTFIARCAIVIAMLIWMTRAPLLRDWIPQRWFVAPMMAEMKKLLSLGWPASLQMLCEVGAFSAAALLVGGFGTIALASHQIALTCAATAFMVPLGLSMALTVHMGEAYGSGQFHRLRPIALSGWSLATGFALFTAVLFILFGRNFAALFVEDPRVVATAGSLLVIVGVFQIVDGLQVAAASMLRGLHDVRLPALMGFFAYWIVGIPCGAYLAYGPIPGPQGVWWGLAIGLAVASLTLCPRLWHLTRDPKVSNNSKNN
jgi:MATE family multidrug resistance protein